MACPRRSITLDTVVHAGLLKAGWPAALLLVGGVKENRALAFAS
jgi:hypothetical protein